RIDIATGEMTEGVFQLDVPPAGWSGVWTLAYHPNGRWIYAGGGARQTGEGHGGGVLRKFAVDTFEPIGDPITFDDTVQTVSFAPSGDLYVLGVGDGGQSRGFIQVRSGEDDSIIREIKDLKAAPEDSAITRDGEFAVARLMSGVVARNVFFDLQKGAEISDEEFFQRRASEVFLPASGMNSQVTRVEHKVTWRSIPAGLLSGHFSSGAAFDREFRFSLTPGGGEVNVVRRTRSPTWRPANEARDTLVKGIAAKHHYAQVHPNQKTFLMSAEDRKTRLVDVESGRVINSAMSVSPKTLALAYSPDGRWCATAGEQLRIWDALTGEPKTSWISHQNSIGAIAFSSDSRWLAAGDYNWKIRIWDVETGEQVGPTLEHRDIVVSLAFSPDGKKLAAGSAMDWNHDPQTRVWDVATWEQIGEPFRHQHYVRHVEFSQDSSLLMAASTDQKIRILNPATCEEIAEIPFSPDALSRARFSPDGKFVLTGVETGQIRLWDAQTGETVGVGVAGRDKVTALAFSPDGARFAVGYANGVSQLFDTQLMQPLAPPETQASAIHDIAVAADGESWITFANPGFAHRWKAPQPATGTAEQLSAKMQVLTRLALRSNTRVEVSLEQWQAQWHLHRLVEVQPDDWVLPARQSRAFAADHQFPEALQSLERARRALEESQRELGVDWVANCAEDFVANENWRAARWHLDILIAERSDHWRAFANRARVFQHLGEEELRQADLARAIELTDNQAFLLGLVDEFADRGEWSAVLQVYERASRAGPLTIGHWRQYTLVMTQTDNVDAYRAACGQLLNSLANTPNSALANAVAWLCAVGPSTQEQAGLAADWLDALIEQSPPPSGAQKHGVYNTLGGALLRAGRYDEAISKIEEGVKEVAGKADVTDHLFLAMAHYGRGDAEEAKRHLSKVDEGMTFDDVWHRMEVQGLIREAKKLIASENQE
ncbi:MAG: hypothetical protein QF805_24045, partial [Pirellulaceae bacterium]|nr:hypothetical protein [Pirellulaceae bacterium]